MQSTVESWSSATNSFLPSVLMPAYLSLFNMIPLFKWIVLYIQSISQTKRTPWCPVWFCQDSDENSELRFYFKLCPFAHFVEIRQLGTCKLCTLILNAKHIFLIKKVNTQAGISDADFEINSLPTSSTLQKLHIVPPLFLKLQNQYFKELGSLPGPNHCMFGFNHPFKGWSLQLEQPGLHFRALSL